MTRERRAWEGLTQSSDDAQWHRWRRRCKDLDQQLRVLEPLCPVLLRAWSKGWHSVADAVGEFHDCTLLLAMVERVQKGVSLPERERKALQHLSKTLKQHRASAQEQARMQGRQLHAQDPRMTIAMLQRWQQLWLAASRTGKASSVHKVAS